jgi:pimeloyl-ACP methyl ester carboxylesterase
MKRLGYQRFVAQGGDWGSLITDQMGVQAPPELLAIHTNLPSAVPAEIAQALPTHLPPPGLPAEEKRAFEQLDAFLSNGLAYALEMAQRPQTVSYGLTDSPAGLLGWMYEKFNEWSDSGGDAGTVLTPDQMLDDVSLYWLTETAASSSRLYWENKLPFFAPTGVRIPVGVSVFPAELYRCPRSWAARAYPHLIHFNDKLENGGHFAAWEQPGLLTSEIRATFRTLR